MSRLYVACLDYLWHGWFTWHTTRACITDIDWCMCRITLAYKTWLIHMPHDAGPACVRWIRDVTHSYIVTFIWTITHSYMTRRWTCWCLEAMLYVCSDIYVCPDICMYTIHLYLTSVLVGMYIYIYIHIYIDVHSIHTSIHTYCTSQPSTYCTSQPSNNPSPKPYIYTYSSLYTYIHIYVYMYMCIYIYKYIYMCIYIYTCIHIDIYTHVHTAPVNRWMIHNRQHLQDRPSGNGLTKFLKSQHATEFTI